METERGERITAWQMAILAHATIATTAVLFLPGIVVRLAGRDAWIVPFLAGLPGLAMLALVIGIARLHPGRSLVQAAIGTLPWGIGRLASLLFILWAIHIGGVIVREFAEFMLGVLLPLTPAALFVGSILGVAAYGAVLGLTTLARMAQVLVVPAFLLAVTITLFVLPEFRAERLLPVLADGMRPLLSGAISPIAWFSELTVFGLLWPHLVDPERAPAAVGISVLAIVFLLAWTTAATVGVFGLLSGYFTFPFFTLATFARVGDFFERFDALIMLFWMGGLYVKIAVFLYAAAAGLGEWLGLPDHRPLVPATALLMGVIAVTAVGSETELLDYLVGVGALYTVTVTFGLAALVGAAGLARRGLRRGGGG